MFLSTCGKLLRENALQSITSDEIYISLKYVGYKWGCLRGFGKLGYNLVTLKSSDRVHLKQFEIFKIFLTTPLTPGEQTQKSVLLQVEASPQIDLNLTFVLYSTQFHHLKIETQFNHYA